MFLRPPAIVLDLDGTLWHDDTLIRGARVFWTMLRRQRIPTVLLTNTGEKTAHDVCRKFEAVMGEAVDPAQVWTALDHTMDVVARSIRAGQFARYTILAPHERWTEYGLDDACRAHRLGDAGGPSECIVFLSDGRVPGDWFDTVGDVARRINAGAHLFASSNDDTLLTSEGHRRVGPGMFLLCVSRLLDAEARARVQAFGKGSDVSMSEAALRKLRGLGFHGRSSDVYFIGDRLNTDIRAAHMVGSIGVHVLSGCHAPPHDAEFPDDSPHVRADAVDALTTHFQERNEARLFYRYVRDRVFTCAAQMRRQSNTLRLMMDRVARLPPRRVWSVPTDLASLDGGDPR